jgi:hypothetical protein
MEHFMLSVVTSESPAAELLYGCNVKVIVQEGCHLEECLWSVDLDGGFPVKDGVF